MSSFGAEDKELKEKIYMRKRDEKRKRSESQRIRNSLTIMNIYSRKKCKN